MNKLQNAVKNAVSVDGLCPELKEAALQLSDKQEILLTTIATYLHYECWEPDHSINAVIKCLNCINHQGTDTSDSTFDILFEYLREPGVIHPALVCYDAFIAHLPVQEKLELRDSCLLILNKYSD